MPSLMNCCTGGFIALKHVRVELPLTDEPCNEQDCMRSEDGDYGLLNDLSINSILLYLSFGSMDHVIMLSLIVSPKEIST